MKKRNAIKQASNIIIFTAAIALTTMQAEASCWTAGVLNGMCYDKTHSIDGPKKKPSEKKCWTAGVLNGMCYDKTHSTDAPKKKSSEKKCWTAGVLNDLCF